MARADQGVAPRIGLALAASFAAHAGLLAALAALPGDTRTAGDFAAPLEVTLRSFAAVVPSAAAQPAKPSRRSSSRYYQTHELERRPQIASHVEPVFPVLALAPAGEVVLALYVNERGGVDRVVVESDDPNGAFAASAREAFSAARFVPATRAGKPVKAQMRIQVLFGSPHPDNAAR